MLLAYSSQIVSFRMDLESALGCAPMKYLFCFSMSESSVSFTGLVIEIS